MSEEQPSYEAGDQRTPLLRSDRAHLAAASQDFLAQHILNKHGRESFLYRFRHGLQGFLVSKWGHYFVLIIVSLDVMCIFADFLLTLHVCEHSGEKGIKTLIDIDEALDTVSLVFSCLFMAELLLSIFAFGPRYLKSKFHIFDACVIIASFVVDVCLHGPLEEAGTLIIVLRLFRVFKIIEEGGGVAEETLDQMQERIESLEKENDTLRKRNPHTYGGSD